MNTAGLVTISSHHSVSDTVSKLTKALEAKGIKLFALIDHSGEAQAAGLHMPDTKLLIFGNPAAGTPLMVASPSLAIDLPLKALIAEDPSGNVSITYNAPAYLRERHGFSPELLPNIAAVEEILKHVAS